jgi:L-alanine-DL-glutamate epimerase-like enolase superfamily enzyme
VLESAPVDTKHAAVRVNDTSLRIASVTTIPYAIPYLKPLKFASGSISVADNVLVMITTEGGTVGIAEAAPRPYTYGETQASIVAVIEQIFGPAIIGLSILEREVIRTRLARTVWNPAAKSAIDMAIWDATGKSLATSVHGLLGGFAPSIRVSHMLGFQDAQAVAAEAVELRETLGINSFKIKVGRRPISSDIAVCEAVREALGPDSEIYLDGNRGWTAAESLEAIRRLDAVGLNRVEELCPADDVLGRRWLVSQCPIPFVADESVVTPAEVTREILSGAATMVSIKTARTGFSDSLRISHLAGGLGVAAVMGSQIDAHLGTICSLVFAASQESTSRAAAELSNHLDLADSLLEEPLTIVDGEMWVPEGPGLGVHLDAEKVQRYRTDN